MTKILVVDDDQEITRMLEKYLSNEGYQVAVASNGAGALAAASATSQNWSCSISCSAAKTGARSCANCDLSATCRSFS